MTDAELEIELAKSEGWDIVSGEGAEYRLPYTASIEAAMGLLPKNEVWEIFQTQTLKSRALECVPQYRVWIGECPSDLDEKWFDSLPQAICLAVAKYRGLNV
jgi:hypothetical protein